MSAFESIAAIVVTAALVENVVLTQMLGLCPFAGLSRRARTASHIGLATTLALTFAAAAAWTIEAAFAVGDAAAILRPLLLVALVACAVQWIEAATRARYPLAHRALGVYLPLIATNCAVLGVALAALRQARIEDGGGGGFAAAVAYGFGGGLGFWLAMIVFAFLRARIVEAKTPRPFRGAPIAMLSAAFLSLALRGFTA